MAGRRTNLALLVVLLLAFATGWLAFSAGTGWGTGVVVAHGVAGLGALALAPWKSAIARRGFAKRRKGTTSSLMLTALVIVSLLAGVSHSLGLAGPVAGLTAMQVHVGAALLAVPFAISHLVHRPSKVRRTDLSRRNLVRGIGIAGGAALLYAGFESVSKVVSLAGANRRFTGSHEAGSHDPSTMPVTQWLNDSVPSIDAEAWSLSVTTIDGDKKWNLEELLKHGQTLTATLDCTGGWYAEQEWTGVGLKALLPEALGRSVVVGSQTGYARRFPIRDLENLFLATGVEGSALSAGHGFPARLVAPGRRGFWWVKWVDHISVDDRPWWLQLPFPAE
jgi:DMSO/TMAO reductase YedYZ molybdopterin-dependent catalytic subunit